jgi:hypothetical protein
MQNLPTGPTSVLDDFPPRGWLDTAVPEFPEGCDKIDYYMEWLVGHLANPRKNAAGRVSIKVNAYFTEYVNADPDVHPDEDEIDFKFAPLFPEKTI